MTADRTLTKGERDDLAKLIRNQERVAKAMATERSVHLLAEFEEQLAATYRYDDDAVWAHAKQAAEVEVDRARVAVAQRCCELGIPPEFAPDLSLTWYCRGQNAVAGRRTELLRAAKRRVEAMEATARREIERVSVEAQGRVIVAGMTGDAALAMLSTLPKAADLMPSIRPGDIEKLLPGIRHRKVADVLAIPDGSPALLAGSNADG